MKLEDIKGYNLLTKRIMLVNDVEEFSCHVATIPPKDWAIRIIQEKNLMIYLPHFPDEEVDKIVSYAKMHKEFMDRNLAIHKLEMTILYPDEKRVSQMYYSLYQDYLLRIKSYYSEHTDDESRFKLSKMLNELILKIEGEK